jgi:hypothetical protein
MIVNLDSLAQREEFDRSGPAASLARVVAMLRVGRLLGGTVLLTDAQLLDGYLLLSLGPKGVGCAIGPHVAVRARAATLDDALAGLVDTGAPTLAGFEFSSLPHTTAAERRALADRLSGLSAERFRALRSTGGTLAALRWALLSAGAAPHAADALAGAWQRWLQADASGEVVVETFVRPELDLGPAAARRPLAPLLDSPDAEEVASRLEARIADGASRSRLRGDVERARLGAEDRQMAHEWLDAIYVRSLAGQHQALVLELPRTGDPGPLRRRATGESTLSLGSGTLDSLGQVSSATFDLIVDRTREDARRWRAGNRPRHLRQLSATIERESAPDTLRRRNQIAEILRLAAFAMILVFVQAIPVGLVAQIAIAAVLAPLAELARLLPLLRPAADLSAVVDPFSGAGP